MLGSSGATPLTLTVLRSSGVGLMVVLRSRAKRLGEGGGLRGEVEGSECGEEGSKSIMLLGAGKPRSQAPLQVSNLLSGPTHHS